jgi:hypothetical protein
MARKLRLEFPGACYHVINRGNYRADVFGTEGAAAAFEACAKSNWVLHAYVVMSKGWAVGTKQFRSVLIMDHQLLADSRAWESTGAGEIREERWQSQLAKCMAKVRKTPEDARNDLKSAPWKVAIAAELKRTSQATNRWLTEQLNMGSAVAVSQYVGRWQRLSAEAKSSRIK